MGPEILGGSQEHKFDLMSIKFQEDTWDHNMKGSVKFHRVRSSGFRGDAYEKLGRKKELDCD